jgi:hypothetical protein
VVILGKYAIKTDIFMAVNKSCLPKADFPVGGGIRSPYRAYFSPRIREFKGEKVMNNGGFLLVVHPLDVSGYSRKWFIMCIEKYLFARNFFNFF